MIWRFRGRPRPAPSRAAAAHQPDRAERPRLRRGEASAPIVDARADEHTRAECRHEAQRSAANPTDERQAAQRGSDDAAISPQIPASNTTAEPDGVRPWRAAARAGSSRGAEYRSWGT